MHIIQTKTTLSWDWPNDLRIWQSHYSIWEHLTRSVVASARYRNPISAKHRSTIHAIPLSSATGLTDGGDFYSFETGRGEDKTVTFMSYSFSVAYERYQKMQAELSQNSQKVLISKTSWFQQLRNVYFYSKVACTELKVWKTNNASEGGVVNVTSL